MTVRPNPFVPADAIPDIDAVLGQLRTDTCVIQRKSADFDPAGAPISGGFATVASVDCQVKGAGRVGVERVFGGQFGPEADYEITMPRETDVRGDDQIIVNGETMEVVSVDDAKSYGFEITVGVKAT